MLRRHEEATLGQGLCDVEVRQVVGEEGAIVLHGLLLLLQSLEDEGDEVIHFCSHAKEE